jgi:hypothetical protein
MRPHCRRPRAPAHPLQLHVDMKEAMEPKARTIVGALMAAAAALSGCAAQGEARVEHDSEAADGVAPAVRHTSFAPLPHDHGTLINSWSTSEPRLLKDRSPGGAAELFGLAWPQDGSDTHIYLYKSGDQGQTWSVTNAPDGPDLARGNETILCSAQDSAGKVHLLYKNWAGEVDYARVALVHDGAGAITGYQIEVDGVALPDDYNTNGDIRPMLQVVRDGTGAEVLVYAVADEPNLGFEVHLGRGPLDAAHSSDFVAIDGAAPGSTTHAFHSGDYGTHNHAVWLAQIGATRDLWVVWGHIDDEFGWPDYSVSMRMRLAVNAGAATWSLDQPIGIEMTGRDVSCETMMGVSGTDQSVWLMYFHPDDGLAFDRIGADGSYTHNAAGPSPQPDAHMNGMGAFSVSPDDRHVYAIWNALVAATPVATAQGYWDGSTWTTFADPIVGDSWGIGGSMYWDEGVAATRLDTSTQEVYVSTISTAP